MEHLLLSSLYVRYFTYLISFKIQQRKCYFLSTKILLFLSTYYHFLNLKKLPKVIVSKLELDPRFDHCSNLQQLLFPPPSSSLD